MNTKKIYTTSFFFKIIPGLSNIGYVEEVLRKYINLVYLLIWKGAQVIGATWEEIQDNCKFRLF